MGRSGIPSAIAMTTSGAASSSCSFCTSGTPCIPLGRCTDCFPSTGVPLGSAFDAPPFPCSESVSGREVRLPISSPPQDGPGCSMLGSGTGGRSQVRVGSHHLPERRPRGEMGAFDLRGPPARTQIGTDTRSNASILTGSPQPSRSEGLVCLLGASMSCASLAPRGSARGGSRAGPILQDGI